MRASSLLENKVQRQSPADTFPSINWQDSPPIQRLLDVISSILAEEYIMIAKQNPKVFSDIASGKMGQSPSLRLRSGQAGTVPIFPHNDKR
jgi:hypothetical protein